MNIFIILVILAISGLLTIDSAYAISCNIDQTILFNEELGKHECVGGTTIDEVKKKKSDSKPWDMSGFTFGGCNTRKQNCGEKFIVIPRELPEKSALELKKEFDKVTSHGYSRNHYLFSMIMQLQEEIAKQHTQNVQNEDFGKLDNFKSMNYSKRLERYEDQELQKNISTQQENATKILENLMNKRHTRY